MKDNKTKKIVATGLVCAMVVSGVGFSTFAKEDTCVIASDSRVGRGTESDAKLDSSNMLSAQITSGIDFDEKDVYKNETVYAFANPDGSINHVLVNEHLKNTDRKQVLTDKTDLINIINLKGDEAFDINGDVITWQADGADIYYQGESDKKLPVDVKVTYMLDGKRIAPDELVGKSGRVTIRYDYTNNTSLVKEINGKKENIKYPFIAISGVLLDDSFKNVSVTNGRFISEGKGNIVVGYALPGLAQSIGLEDKDLKNTISMPEYFEISADVTDFSLGMSVTVLANGSNAVMGSEFDFAELDKMVAEISTAGNELSSGSAELAEGIGTLNGKMSEFNEGVGKLKAGIDTLGTNSDELINGIDQINNSASTVANGIATLDQALNTPMGDEEKQSIAGSASAAVSAQFAEGTDTYNYIYGSAAEQFVGTMTSETTVDQIYQGLYANLHDPLYGAAVADAMQQAMAAGMQVTKEDIIASQGGAIEAGISAKLYELANGIAGGIAENGKDAIGRNVVGACESAATQAASQAAVMGAEGAKQTIAGRIEAVSDSGYSLVSGSQALSSGAGKLAAGTPALKEGIDNLCEGANALASGSSQLADGTSRLAAGSSELKAGINQFNNDAIKKMVSTYDGDVKALAGRIEAVLNAASMYDTYTALEDGATGTTKFIIKISEIK